MESNSSLPLEVWIQILEQLTSTVDLGHVILTCRSLHDAYTVKEERVLLSVRLGQLLELIASIDEEHVLPLVEELYVELRQLNRTEDSISFLKEVVRKQLEAKHHGMYIDFTVQRLEVELRELGRTEELISFLKEVVRKQLEANLYAGMCDNLIMQRLYFELEELGRTREWIDFVRDRIQHIVNGLRVKFAKLGRMDEFIDFLKEVARKVLEDGNDPILTNDAVRWVCSELEELGRTEEWIDFVKEVVCKQLEIEEDWSWIETSMDGLDRRLEALDRTEEFERFFKEATREKLNYLLTNERFGVWVRGRQNHGQRLSHL